MKAEDIAWIEEAVESLDAEPITVETFQAVSVGEIDHADAEE